MASDPAIAQDRSACGWFVQYKWPGVQYTIPQVVAVYSPGRSLKYFGPSDVNLIVMVSCIFVRGGKQVAIYRDTLHGPSAPTFELYDVETGRMLDTFYGELTRKSPPWTRGLSAE